MTRYADEDAQRVLQIDKEIVLLYRERRKIRARQAEVGALMGIQRRVEIQREKAKYDPNIRLVKTVGLRTASALLSAGGFGKSAVEKILALPRPITIESLTAAIGGYKLLRLNLHNPNLPANLVRLLNRHSRWRP
jgi:DNA-binding XRE family transcriptional regulator